MQALRDIPLNCANKVLCNIGATLDYGILYKKNVSIRLEGYTTVDWVENVMEYHRSKSIFVFSLGFGAHGATRNNKK